MNQLTKEIFGFEIPYISTANWVIIAALFFFLTFISVWALFGKSALRDFFMSSFTKSDGRADEKKLTMFSVLLIQHFLLIRGAITGNWPPSHVFWGNMLLIAVWLGFAYQLVKVKETIDAEKSKFLSTTTTKLEVTEETQNPENKKIIE